MGRRSQHKNYRWPGIYHITMTVGDRRQQSLGRIVGDTSKPDGDPEAPHVELSEIGKMVEYELLHSISAYYPMVEVQDYVVMPDHVHCIMVVKHDIVSRNGKPTHLGQVISGFKKGCTRRYWEITGMTAAGQRNQQRGNPAVAESGLTSVAAGSAPCDLPPAGSPQVYVKVPSRMTTGLPQLFSDGYVDVMPLREGQLETQRAYIRNNPRYRLLRSLNKESMRPLRGGIDTALRLVALRGYLKRECGASQFDEEVWASLTPRLLQHDGVVDCDSYGNRQLLEKRLLPVVCHRKDLRSFALQKEACLTAARNGAVLVSARISPGEQDIMNAAMAEGLPVINIEDNGMAELYHPSEQRMALCVDDKLLIVTPWVYLYRPAEESITVATCKTMNCVAQALCQQKDDWWKGRQAPGITG
jgi:REP element-mobilizing transposase RayT